MGVGDRTANAGLVGALSELAGALSELAARMQRERTRDAVLRVAGEGVARLGMRLLVLQLEGSDLVLRFLTIAPARCEEVERLMGQRLVGLRAPLDRCGPAPEIVAQRKNVYGSDLELFVRFLEAATGRTPFPLDASRPPTENGIVAPLMARDEPWGLLSLVSPSFHPEDTAAVALFAAHLGSALEVAEFVQTLQRSQEELVARERLATIGELAATVAHEVRNPLGVLFNSVASLRRLVRKDVGRAKRTDAEMLLSILTEETERLNDIVVDLLELARPWAMRTSETSFASVVQSVTSALPRLPDGSAVDVHLEMCPDLPPVDIDARMVRQALRNLVLNAVQTMPKGGTLRVETRMEHHDDLSFACIDVTDPASTAAPDGPAPELEPLFTPNEPGLGLALVKRVAEAHGGDLASVSDETGTTFTMRLPMPKWDDSQVRVTREAAAARRLRAAGTG
jgi:signal transduction histidine kinase